MRPNIFILAKNTQTATRFRKMSGLQSVREGNILSSPEQLYGLDSAVVLLVGDGPAAPIPQPYQDVIAARSDNIVLLRVATW